MADAFLCLGTWTKPDRLSADCAATLPVKEPEVPRKKRKSKAAAKRKAYEESLKLKAQQDAAEAEKKNNPTKKQKPTL